MMCDTLVKWHTPAQRQLKLFSASSSGQKIWHSQTFCIFAPWLIVDFNQKACDVLLSFCLTFNVTFKQLQKIYSSWLVDACAEMRCKCTSQLLYSRKYSAFRMCLDTCKFPIESYSKQVLQLWGLWQQNASNFRKYDVVSTFTT